MKILNLGSLNIDYLYRVPHLVKPGETLSSSSLSTVAGGKGNNQSIALARAGMAVQHAGRIGSDGLFLRDLLAKEHVDVTQVIVTETPTGNAFIQVDDQGENSIILYAGANHSFTETDIRTILETGDNDTAFLTQNETNLVGFALEEAIKKERKIFFNPAPFSKEVLNYPLEKIYCLIVNLTEGQGLTGKVTPEEVFAALKTTYPHTNLLLTLGELGVWCYWPSETGGLKEFRQKSIPADVVDTTAAGDTFIGYFMASLFQHQLSVPESLYRACVAASVCVSRPGASVSIPFWNDLNA